MFFAPHLLIVFALRNRSDGRMNVVNVLKNNIIAVEIFLIGSVSRYFVQSDENLGSGIDRA